jgi:hypothetical protein
MRVGALYLLVALVVLVSSTSSPSTTSAPAVGSLPGVVVLWLVVWLVGPFGGEVGRGYELVGDGLGVEDLAQHL